MRVGTSRFIAQGPFLAYKAVMAVFFMSWAIYWREAGATVVLAKCEHEAVVLGVELSLLVLCLYLRGVWSRALERFAEKTEATRWSSFAE